MYLFFEMCFPESKSIRPSSLWQSQDPESVKDILHVQYMFVV